MMSAHLSTGDTEVFMRLRDRTALVTGGGTGIGRAIAAAFVAEGARVAIASRDSSQLERAARELDPSGERVTAVAMDVTDRASVARGVESLAARGGGIDILGN